MAIPPSQAGKLSARQQFVLAEMGVDVWVSRADNAARKTAESAALIAAVPEAPSKAEPVTSAEINTTPAVAAPEEQPAVYPAATGEWAGLNEAIRSCRQCDLHATRTQAVCGVGNTAADWLIIGEAPGADEDQQGEPFVGRAGQLLNEMLRAAGQSREQVFIANILKCRPPNNRDPKPFEVEQCWSFLHQQIAMVKPRLILVVGRIAAHNLLKVDVPIGKLRGQVHYYGETNIPVVVTYHPAYLLRSPGQKSKSWEDLMLAMDVVAGSGEGSKGGAA